MSLGRMAPDVGRALARAHAAAAAARRGEVDETDLVVALLDDSARGFGKALRQAGANVDGVLLALLPSSNGRGGKATLLYPAAPLTAALVGARRRARGRGRRETSLSDLVEELLGEATGGPVRAQVLDLGVKPQEIDRAVASLRTGTAGATDGPRARTLRKFSRCLTDLARDGQLDPVVGRHREVHRLMHVLCRRAKNNPLLVGAPGIGKSSIAAGLAHRIAEGDAPKALARKSVFALDVGAVAAGSDYRGVAEERVKAAIDDARESGRQCVLLIEDLHALVRGGQGAPDVGGALKPALASGDLRCIATATPEGYRNHIENDPALARSFQPIFIDEPSVAEAVSILRGLRAAYESHHEIHITDEALEAAASLSHRFITEHSLPAKAIDLIDEAAARAAIEREMPPAEIDEGKRRARQLDAELRGMIAEGVEDRLVDATEEERDRLRAEAAAAERAWDDQRTLGEQARALREQLEWVELLEAHHGGNGTAPNTSRALTQLRRRLDRVEKDLLALQEERRLYRPALGSEDVAQAVAVWTGIPARKVVEDERAKLLAMEKTLHERVVGQDKAVTAVSRAVRLARAGMKDPNRPVGSFLFLGPTGVGKTELSRAVAEFLFDDEAAMVRIDMSEYMEKHSVSRLLGAPPGYIGYEDSGQLTEYVRRRPYSVVLFDEIEKAHPDVFNLLLQIMDDGRLTDGHGRTVDFKSVILIMTSNVGGHLYREAIDRPANELDGLLQEALRSSFRPEFLNRVDAIVRFDLLSKRQIKDIVDIQIRQVNRRLEAGGIVLEAQDEVRDYLADLGFDRLQGARPLKRLIQHEVLEPLADRVLRGEFVAGDTVVLTLGRGGKGVTLRRRRPKRRRTARSRPESAAPELFDEEDGGPSGAESSGADGSAESTPPLSPERLIHEARTSSPGNYGAPCSE